MNTQVITATTSLPDSSMDFIYDTQNGQWDAQDETDITHPRYHADEEDLEQAKRNADTVAPMLKDIQLCWQNPEPPNIQIYDNEGQSMDRYTVLYLDQIERPEYVSKDYLGKPCLIGPSYNSFGMSAEPFHPQGIGQHGAAMPGKHLGKVITWEELPVDCQRAVLQDLP